MFQRGDDRLVGNRYAGSESARRTEQESGLGLRNDPSKCGHVLCSYVVFTVIRREHTPFLENKYLIDIQ